MQKKWLMMGTSLGIGAVMLLVSGFSAMANTSGYDAYKTAVNHNKSLSSMTSVGSITLKDNGTDIQKADITAKVNREQRAGSVAVKLGSGLEQYAANIFNQDGKFIFKSGSSDVYKVTDSRVSEWKHDGEQAGPPKQLEPVIDTLMGNLKELATVEATSDGGVQASLHLTGSQIPMIVRALGPLLISKVTNHEQWNAEGTHPDKAIELTSKLPKLVEDITIERINLDASINKEQFLVRQAGEIVITGSDDQGESHELVIGVDFNFSDFNQTTPDQVDLTGKQVEEIQKDEKGAPWRH